MSLPRFYCQTISDNCVIEGSEAHHICSVLRFGKGDRVELFDGKGTTASAIITAAGKRGVSLEPQKITFEQPRPHSRIVLVVSVAKDQRFDWLIAKATELGVEHICPALYHRTVKQSSGTAITQRYINIAVSSAKQSKRSYLPIIEKTRTFLEHLCALERQYDNHLLITSSLSDKAVNLLKSPAIDTTADKIIFVGPEGGFTEDEEAALNEKNALQVRLTRTILRVETAALAIASVFAINRDC